MATTRYRLFAATAVGAAPFLLGRIARVALGAVVTDTSKLMELALAISKSSPRIRDYAIEQARVSISQELALAGLNARVATLEAPPAPAPAPTPAPPSGYLNDLGAFSRPAWEWSVSENWHPDSARLLGILKASAQSAVVALSSYGVAIARASSSDPLVTVTNTNGWGNKPTGGSFFCPTAAKPANGTDAHLVVVQPDGSIWEMWKAVRNGGNWTAGAVGYANPGEWNYPLASCRGSSFTLASGLLAPEDVKVDGPSHALLTILPSAAVRKASMLPSNDTDGIQADGIPEGARIVLDPAASLTGLTGLTLAIAQAGQRYGWIVGDKTGGTDMSFAAVAPETWTAFGQQDQWAAKGLSGYPNVTALLALLPKCRIENQPIKLK